MLASDAQHYHGVLHELIDMDLARIVHGQAKAAASAPLDAEASAPPGPDATITFDRIARAVRRSIALARSLAEPVRAHPDAAACRVARKLVIRGVEDAIERHAGSDADALHSEFAERLDTADLDDDIALRPVADIIADVCRDLGLAGPQIWMRRTPADVAALHARAATAVQDLGIMAPRRRTGGPVSSPVEGEHRAALP